MNLLLVEIEETNQKSVTDESEKKEKEATEDNNRAMEESINIFRNAGSESTKSN